MPDNENFELLLNYGNFLNDNQHGFLPYKSCET